MPALFKGEPVIYCIFFMHTILTGFNHTIEAAFGRRRFHSD